MVDTVRIEIIKKLWNEIHGNRLCIFYWSDDTETQYWYNSKDDVIQSDNGFSVKIDIPTDKLNKDDLIYLIETLQGNIIRYYKVNYNRNIYYND